MRKIFSLFLFTLTATCSFARYISKDSCQVIATNFFHEQTGKSPTILSVINIEDTAASGHRFIVGYVVNFTGGGWAWVLNNGQVNPRYAYNPTDSFTVKNIPVGNGVEWAIWHQQEKTYASSLLKTSHTHQPARLLGGKTFATVVKTVGPLLKTAYDQTTCYNTFCPNDGKGCGNACTGCVSTAMAQVMKFWNWPPTGTGSYSYCDCTPYYTENYGTLSANFNHPYNWQNTPNACTGTANDTFIARLMSDLGISVAMDYASICFGGSGAFVQGGNPSAHYSYVNYFKYQNSIKDVNQSDYASNPAAYIALLVSELDAGRPIQYEGFDPSGSGHTWITDGYQQMSDGTFLFHENWGWSNQNNGWFNINALNVSGYSFTTYTGGLVGIQPNGTPPQTCPISPITTSSITTTSATLAWTPTAPDSIAILKYGVHGSNVWATLNVVSGTATLASLSPGTTYDYQLQEICSASVSAINAGSFTTLAPCPTPYGLAIGATTDSSQDLTWSYIAGATYIVGYKPASGTTWNYINTAGTELNLTGLIANTAYNWNVQSVCAAGKSLVSSTQSFTTLPAPVVDTCAKATNLTATNVTKTSATVSWTPATNVIAQYLIYNSQVRLAYTSIMLAPNVSSYNLNKLSSGVKFNVFIKTVCTSTSANSGTVSFTTKRLGK